MTIYILDRTKPAAEMIWNKDLDQAVSLYTEMHDCGIHDHSTGLVNGTADQLAFALYYDHTKDLEWSLEKHEELARHLNLIVPEVVEVSAEDIIRSK